MAQYSVSSTKHATGHVLQERLWKLNQDEKVVRSGCPVTVEMQEDSVQRTLGGEKTHWLKTYI